MPLDKKKYNLLKSFLDTYKVEGVCEFLIIEDGDEDDSYSVIIVFDLDWLKSISTKVEFITRRYRKGMKEEILNFTGLDVPYVGSTAKKCDESILESLSPKIRRRLKYHMLKSDLDYGVIDEMNPCEYSTPGEFVAEACDMLKDIVLDYYFDIRVSSSDKDQLYYYFVNEFGSYLVEIYHRRCPDIRKHIIRMNESTRADNVKKVLYKVLDSMSEDWNVKEFNFDEMTISDSEGWTVLQYDTERGDNGKLFIDPLLLKTVIGYGTIGDLEPDEYDIRDWFNQKYNRNAREIEIYEEEY
jgi:hypothetical protein